MRVKILAAAALGLTVASCDRPVDRTEAPPTAPAFSYASTGDLSGYYMPLSETRFGPWSFDHLFVGGPAEFEAWRSGRRSGTFGPVMLQFDDVGSPMIQTEIGESRSVTERVLPTAYAVTDDRIRFEGRSARLGKVAFDGRLDPAALATARRNLGDEGAVVVGALTVGDFPPARVRLRWWMGD